MSNLSSSRKYSIGIWFLGLLLVVAVGTWLHVTRMAPPSGEKILGFIERQVNLGPRHLSAPGHAKVQELLRTELLAVTDDVRMQTWQHKAKDGTAYQLTNVIARLYPERSRRIIVGAHYDSKRLASLDKASSKTGQPVPGANDGASGVAVITEVAQVLMRQKALQSSDLGIDIVFFDGEEGEESIIDDYTGWEPLGSAYFAGRLPSLYPASKPELGIVLDMVCEKDLQLFREPNSFKAAPEQVNAFWRIGRDRYPQLFGLDAGTAMLDDHTQLNKAGIPSFLVIDYDYAAYHTTEDTPDKCRAANVEAVARTLHAYILRLAR